MFARITLAILTALILGAAVSFIQPTAAQSSDRIRTVVWNDANCDGVRQDSEALIPNLTLTLRWAGANGTIDATDRDIEQAGSLVGQYAFTLAAAGEPYFISFRNEDKPAGMVPAPFRQGSDPARDNDLTMPLTGTSLWATPVFTMPADGAMVTGIDLGLCTPTFDPANTVYLPSLRR
ncbi:SdrD B-like domain-containing protein [Chloroflexus sp.]|uniref:SdrD B-like domain-containing protein n=1 Tax=Chloroflexus sp. TaxID=1904827 RepID=UPI002ACE0814|nr:SdrD B-like domain-containing protein [Chloroflexus sp.]